MTFALFFGLMAVLMLYELIKAAVSTITSPTVRMLVYGLLCVLFLVLAFLLGGGAHLSISH